MSSKTYRRIFMALGIALLFLPAVGIWVRLLSGGRDGDGLPAAGGNVAAAEFPPGLEWLNTPRPIRIDELGGKVVLLNFWASGCADCARVNTDVARLRHEYAEELVVIGVYSAAPTGPADSDQAREAIARYGIEYPVVIDSDMQIQGAYGVSTLPTLMLIDPGGSIVAYVSGGSFYDYDSLDRAIGELVRIFDGRGLLRRGRVPAAPADNAGDAP